MFSADEPKNNSQVLSVIVAVITEEENMLLEASLTKEEVSDN